jgi:hypothetical protein
MRKLEVSLERDSRGRLHGYVLERYEDSDGSSEQIAKGEDLLKDRTIRDVESAVGECNRRLKAMFKLIDPPTIVFISPNNQEE